MYFFKYIAIAYGKCEHIYRVYMLKVFSVKKVLSICKFGLNARVRNLILSHSSASFKLLSWKFAISSPKAFRSGQGLATAVLQVLMQTGRCHATQDLFKLALLFTLQVDL